MSKSDRGYWYTYADIDHILKTKAEESYKVVDATPDELQSLQKVNEAFTSLGEDGGLSVGMCK